ncbi:MAG: hypothetical protein M3R36_12275 [Bacteroidota bacterium]|nr:hypothetical protein [Bacteroidota bacterium]
MKTTISFLSALVLVIVIGFYLTPENSSASSYSENASGFCCIYGINASPNSTAAATDAAGNVVTAPVNGSGWFRICFLDPNTVYSVSWTKNGCTARVGGQTCAKQVNFKNIPADCK